ncbi:MAG TPA: NAD-dependent epimerase/dehydratase family protein [Candidatus Saccharimonadales bacterium]|nr:NAD-dependent epimerase/dehydratase family protein [Candidatus Saccharimonadales bacterium]
MGERIFLTGSTSYLGTKFIEMYGSQFDILGVSRSDKDNPLDLLDFDEVERLFVGFKPDVVMHLAADLGRDSTTSTEITETNPAITRHLVSLAKTAMTPFIFTSTEAVYGGKETTGGYAETDEYKPRSPYGASKVASERLLIASGLPYLITRGHRHVGISKNFNKPKQFPDTLKEINGGQTVHVDSQKIFTPVLINNACDIFAHYIANDTDKQLIMNIGVDKPTTYYDFMLDVAKELGIDGALVQPDGNEAGWPQNSSLSMRRLQELSYPSVGYDEMLTTIKDEV